MRVLPFLSSLPPISRCRRTAWLMLACYLVNFWFAAWIAVASGTAGRPDGFVSLCTANGLVIVSVHDLEGSTVPVVPDTPLSGAHCPFCLLQHFPHLPSAFSLPLPLPDAQQFAAIRNSGPPAPAPDWHHAPARAPPVFSFA
ncbi:MAG: DUF2946 family protein [Azoarcus sp.]|nr:DUF2946 family protein [Azoarcus sp.]